MRTDLKVINGEEISGVAKVFKRGHRFLLKQVAIDDPTSFDPDVFLAFENHLWVDGDAFDRVSISKYGLFRFKGEVYEYERKDGTIDYSVKMKTITPIDTIEYFRKEATQFYCRNICLYFDYCYYNCNFSKNQVNQFVEPIFENFLIGNFVEDYKEELSTNKNLLKELRAISSMKIGENSIFIGMHEQDFKKRFKDHTRDDRFYRIKPISVNNIPVTPILNFTSTGICDFIAFEEVLSKDNSIEDRTRNFQKIKDFFEEKFADEKDFFFNMLEATSLEKVLKFESKFTSNLSINFACPNDERANVFIINMPTPLSIAIEEGN